MKKQFYFSIPSDSAVAKYMECIRHKKGAVLAALIETHLAENGGYLSPEIAAEAGYRFTKKDAEFAEWFVGRGKNGKSKAVIPRISEESSVEVDGNERGDASAETPIVGREDPSSLPVGRFPRDDKAQSGNQPSRMTEISVAQNDDVKDGYPQVKNQDMVLAGLSAFLG